MAYLCILKLKEMLKQGTKILIKTAIGGLVGTTTCNEWGNGWGGIFSMVKFPKFAKEFYITKNRHGEWSLLTYGGMYFNLAQRTIYGQDDRNISERLQNFCKRYSEMMYVGAGNQFIGIAPINSIGHRIAKRYNMCREDGVYVSPPKDYVFIGEVVYEGN
jgi:hypothetical protein